MWAREFLERSKVSSSSPGDRATLESDLSTELLAGEFLEPGWDPAVPAWTPRKWPSRNAVSGRPVEGRLQGGGLARPSRQRLDPDV